MWTRWSSEDACISWYKAAPKVELSAEERILVSEGGTASPTPAPGGIAGTGETIPFKKASHERLLSHQFHHV